MMNRRAFVGAVGIVCISCSLWCPRFSAEAQDKAGEVNLLANKQVEKDFAEWRMRGMEGNGGVGTQSDGTTIRQEDWTVSDAYEDVTRFYAQKMGYGDKLITKFVTGATSAHAVGLKGDPTVFHSDNRGGLKLSCLIRAYSAYTMSVTLSRLDTEKVTHVTLFRIDR